MENALEYCVNQLYKNLLGTLIKGQLRIVLVLGKECSQPVGTGFLEIPPLMQYLLHVHFYYFWLLS